MWNQFLLYFQSSNQLICMNSNSKKHCSICENPNGQIKMMIASLKSLLKKKLKDSADQFNVQLKRGEKNSLPRLLEMMIGESAYLRLGDSKCCHLSLFNVLKRKLRCSAETLSGMIEGQIYQLAQRNFHIDVIKKQISGAAQRILKIDMPTLTDKQMEQKAEIEKNSEKGPPQEQILKAPVFKIEENIEERQEIENQESNKMEQNFIFIPMFFPSNLPQFNASYWI